MLSGKDRLVLVAVAALSCAGVSRGAILDEKWTGYNNGDPPASPWSVAQVSASNESVQIDNGRLHYNDDGFNDTSLGYDNNTKQNWNPEVKYTFSQSTTSPLNIRFSYSIPADKTGAQLQLALRDSSGKAALSIGLGKNWAVNGLYYVDSTGTSIPLTGQAFAVGETVTVTLSNIDLSTKTYNIAWSTDKVNAAVTSGAALATFRDATVTNFASLFLSNNASGNAKAEMYLGPVLVEAVPEPASLSLLTLAGAGLLWRRTRK